MLQPQTQTTQKNSSTPSSRIPAIDRFRGIAIFCMIFFQFINNFDAFGLLARFSEHNITKGIIAFQNTTIADLIAPMFMFALALTYKMSYDRRVERHGRKSTDIHFLVRYLGLIGIGSALYAVNQLIDILGGDAPRIVDWIFISLTVITLVTSLLILLFSIKPLQKLRPHVSKTFYLVIATMGLVTLVVGAIDLVNLTLQTTAYSPLKYWLVLQPLGFAGLIALPFMRLNAKWRGIAGVALFALYMFYYNALGGQVVVNAITQGGFAGGFGWGLLVLLATVFAEVFQKNKQNAYLITLFAIAVSLIAYVALPIMKSGVRPDPTYLLMSMSISAFVFVVVDLFNFYKSPFDPLSWWGRYPILLYLIEFAVLGSILMAVSDMAATASLPVAIISAIAMVVAITTLVYFLNKKNKRISL